MSVLSNFENRIEGAVDGAAAAMFSSPIEPAQIAKKAEKQMKREKLVGSGRQYAPTLYNVLVNERDDKRLLGFYPTMATEIENYLYAKGTEAGMEFDARPLVRFIPDPGLKKGRFDVIAEVVAAPIIKKLRQEELEYYGLAPKGSAFAEEEEAAAYRGSGGAAGRQARQQQQQQQQGGAYAGASAYGGKAPGDPLAGFDVPADIDDAYEPVRDVPSRPSGAAAHGAHAAAGAIPNPAAAAAYAAPAVGSAYAGSHRGASGDNAAGELGDQAVIGNAMLYNCSEQRSHSLKTRKLTIGRGRENDIMLADANASRVHARLSQDATGRWKVSDLGSTNGTLLNDRPVTSAILKSGDEITIGTTVLQFVE